jgi:HemY protein
MRLGVAALLAIVLGAFAAHFVLADRGYVLVNFRGYVVEMSVPGLVIVLVLGYLLVRAIVAVADAPRRWRATRAERYITRSGANLTGGVLELIAGNWARSERLLTRGAQHEDTVLVNYLLAARAAQLQGSTERRDEWLKLAHDLSGDGATSAGLTRAALELQAHEPAAAVATLTALERERGELPAAVAMLARAYRALDDRAALYALLPRLARAALPDAERDELVALALEGELMSAELTTERLDALWDGLTPDMRAAPALLARRALALDKLGRGAEAERELRAALKRDWHPQLVQSYGEIRGADAAKQLKQAETWLKSYPEDAALLLAAARFCMASELWGKARSYLESSLALKPVPEAYALYGRLLAELGESEQALLAFRKGLGLVTHAVAEPLPPVRSLAPPTPKLEANAKG